MSGKNPFLGLGFGSPFITFARASSSASGASSDPKIVVSAPFDNNNLTSSGSVYIYNLDGTGEVKLTASDAAAGDNFGKSVAIGNNKIVVGARTRDVGTLENAGSVYVYDLDGTNEVKITASDAASADYFGASVAIAHNKIVVGAYLDDAGNNNNLTNSGSAYVYNLDGTGEVKLTASDANLNDVLGISVAIGSNKIVTGSTGDDDDGTNSGSVYVYDLDGTNELKITASDGAADARFGVSVAIAHNKIVVGAAYRNTQTGDVYVYNLDGTGETKITASDAASGDYFGWDVAIG